MMPAPCATNASMEDYGRAKTVALLRVASEAVAAAAAAPRPEAVHAMRVSIRRLQQAIRLFRQFLREKGVRAVRTELRGAMDAAGALRNLDIACSLVSRAGGDTAALRERRLPARQALQAVLRELARTDLQQRWMKALGLTDGQATKEALER
jgi:CHAD domain-containing protein